MTNVLEAVTRIKALGALVMLENRQIEFCRAQRARRVDSPCDKLVRNACAMPGREQIDLLKFERPGCGVNGGCP